MIDVSPIRTFRTISKPADRPRLLNSTCTIVVTPPLLPLPKRTVLCTKGASSRRRILLELCADRLADPLAQTLTPIPRIPARARIAVAPAITGFGLTVSQSVNHSNVSNDKGRTGSHETSDVQNYAPVMHGYPKTLSGWGDLNSRPLDPQSSALTKLRHSPCSTRSYPPMPNGWPPTRRR